MLCQDSQVAFLQLTCDIVFCNFWLQALLSCLCAAGMKTAGDLCPWHNMVAEHFLLSSTGNHQHLLRHVLSPHDMPAATCIVGHCALYKVPTDLVCGVSNESRSSDLSQVATLEQQVANLERQRLQEAASLRGSAEHMQREMQGHCTNLQAQLDAFQVPFPAAASCCCLLLLPFTVAFQVPHSAASSCCVSFFACHCCPSHAFQAVHCL